MHVITPSDLKKFQIEKYSEMIKNQLSVNHEKFLLNELKQLNENNTDNTDGTWLYRDLNSSALYSQNNKRIEKIKTESGL